jgi:membrane protease YdiL (CAAX protease family)
LIRALLAGILLVGVSGPVVAAPNQLPAPFEVAAGSHKQHIDRVRNSNQNEFERVLRQYDAYLEEHPNDVVAAVEKCRFVERFAYAEDEMLVESSPDALERCRETVGSGPYAAEPVAQLYMLESKWGDEGIAAGEELIRASRSWPRQLRAELHARMADLYQTEDNEEKTGAHAVQAVELDPASRALIVAAKRFEKLGAKERARTLITAAPAAVWNEVPVGEASALLVRLGAAREAVALLRARESLGDSTFDRFLLARALLGDGQIAQARDAYSEAVKTSGPFDYIGLREYFAFERSFGSRAQAEAAYSRLRDIGFVADPFGRYRLDLLITHPLARWRLRDLTGILAFLGAIGLAALLPLVVIAPVHYRSLVLRLRGRDPANTALPWGLRHAWHVLAVTVVAQLIALYWLAYPSFEDALGWAPFNNPLTDDRSLGRAFLLGILLTAACLTPVLRGVRWLSFVEGQWPLRRSLGAATAALLAFRFAATLWVTIPNSFEGAALGSDTTRALQGLYAEHGIVALLLFVAVAIPIVEEVVFRGVLLNGLARHVSFPIAATMQALVFAALHEDLANMPLFFVFGLASAWLYRRSQGLAAPLAFHVFNNGLAALAIVALTKALSQAP